MTRSRRHVTAVARTLAPSSGLVVLVALASSSCLFAPDIAGAGYVACKSDDDCDPGRTCASDANVCAPPPWDDQQYEARRLLTITNNDTALLKKGTAVPVVVGGDHGVLTLDDVKADFRVTDFSPATQKWSVLSVFIDPQSDRFTTWIATQRDIEPGRSDALAFIESETTAGVVTVHEDPRATFAFFEDFAQPLDDSAWRVRGSPTQADGKINVGQQQSIVLKQPFTPPVTATALVRVNGVTCDKVFVGFIGDDRSLFAVGPSAGVFVDQDLASTAQIAPDAASVPTAVGAPFTSTTGFARASVAVDGGGVQIGVDDNVAYLESDLRPPFANAPLYLAILVGGACSVDVDAVWVTPLPQPAPTVTAAGIVRFQLFN